MERVRAGYAHSPIGELCHAMEHSAKTRHMPVALVVVPFFVVAGRLAHACNIRRAAVEAAYDVHGVALGEPARGSQLELLARLEQPQLAARQETELGRDAGEHGRGSVIAAHAVERAVLAAQVPEEDLEGRRVNVGSTLELDGELTEVARDQRIELGRSMP